MENMIYHGESQNKFQRLKGKTQDFFVGAPNLNQLLSRKPSCISALARKVMP